MRPASIRISCLLVSLLCFSATVKSQAPPADAVAPEEAAFNGVYAHLSIPRVTGKLLNLSVEELKNLTISYTVVTPFSESQERKTVFAQPDGSFSLDLDYAFPYQQIWFGVGDFFYAGLYANKDLYLELDMKKIKAAKEVNFNGEGVHYLGTDGPLNVYMNNYVLYKRDDQLRLYGNINTLLHSSQTPVGDWLSDYNRLSDSLKKIQDDYVSANPSPYGWILENERMSDYYAQICPNYWGKTMDDTLWQKMNMQKSYLVSNSSSQLYNYMTTYISNLPGDKRPSMQKFLLMQSLDKSIQRIDSLFSPAKADFLKLRLSTSKDVNEQKTSLEHILRSMHTDWCVAVEKREYQRTVDKVDEINKTLARSVGGTQHTSFGKPLIETSFGASMYEVSGMKAVDFLAKLKQSFPDKAIVIDLWATWCGPCLGEMQHTRELQEASKDLPVVFVYLCTIHGSSEDKWKSKVVELKQPGIHFLIDETLDAELAHYFSFSGYPGHAFIDKTGTYKPGAIKWMSEIENREALAALINK